MEVASSATREVIAVVREGSRIIKKRLVEKSELDQCSSPSSFLDDDTFDVFASQADTSRPSNEQDAYKKLPRGNKSRSVSVSATRACHVNSRLPLPRP